MPVTLRELAAEPSLGITVHAEAEVPRRPVTWVHTSELDDPSPFLEGGELLLTTGMGLVAEPARCRAYVHRLSAAGVAGLGFGVGLSHDEVPEPLTAAAREAGLPLLVVPRETPFIALSKVVSRAVAADEYAELRRTSKAQRELARAGGGQDGLAALTRKLAGLLDAWVLVLDPAGVPLHAAPRSAAAKHGALETDIARLRGKRGLAAARTSLAGADVSLQVLGTRGHGFLAVGRSEPLSTTDHHVTNTAASLLTLALQQRHSLGAARRQVRTSIVELLMRGETDLARRTLRALGHELPTGPSHVFVVDDGRRPETTLDLLESEVTRLTDPPLLAPHDGRVVAVAGDGDGAEWLADLPDRHENMRVGVSDACTADGIAEGYRQALDAVRHASGATLRFTELAGGGLLRLIDDSDARAFADSLLAPLVHHDSTTRSDLITSLRAWLAQHGQWDPAASQLGVHRHTLRNRMRKVEDLLGRSLDQPGLRAELWLALRVFDAHA